MLIQELMIPKEKLIITEAMTPLKDALRLMRKHGVKSLVVNKSRPDDAYGLLTFKHIIHSILACDGDIDMLRVYDLYVKPTIQLSPQLGVKYAAKMMMNHSIKRILVVDNNELLGMITMTDMLGVLLDSVEEKN